MQSPRLRKRSGRDTYEGLLALLESGDVTRVSRQRQVFESYLRQINKIMKDEQILRYDSVGNKANLKMMRQIARMIEKIQKTYGPSPDPKARRNRRIAAYRELIQSIAESKEIVDGRKVDPTAGKPRLRDCRVIVRMLYQEGTVKITLKRSLDLSKARRGKHC